MEVRLMLKDHAGRATKDKCGEGIDCWGSEQKKDLGEKNHLQMTEGSGSMGHICCCFQQHSSIL